MNTSASTMPKVLITGCEFWSPSEGKWCHGDLWKVGQTYVFNAVTDGKGETAWEYGSIPSHTLRALVSWDGPLYFERRGVLVIAMDKAILNDTAASYLHGTPH